MSIERPVVVGVDGSTASQHAVAWAARAAALRGVPLRIVHAVDVPFDGLPTGASVYTPPDLSGAGEGLLQRAADEAASLQAGLEISTEVLTRSTVPALLGASDGADLLVLGFHGRSAASRLLLGSTSDALARHATCPVVLVHPETSLGDEHPVVVGVDGSLASQPALELAFTEAKLLQCEVIAVHAFVTAHDLVPVMPLSGMQTGEIPVLVAGSELPEPTAASVMEWVSGVAARHPEVRFSCRVVRGEAGHVLVDESARAQLLVVGSKGHGALASLLLGSTSYTALHRARSTVAVAR